MATASSANRRSAAARTASERATARGTPGTVSKVASAASGSTATMTWPRVWSCTAATPRASTVHSATAWQRAITRPAAVARPAWRRSSASARAAVCAMAASAASSAPKASSSGAPSQRVHHLGRERPGQGGDLVVAAPAPGQRGGDHEGHGQREAEPERGPREDEADDDRAERGGTDGHGDRQHGAQVEVLERVDVVDGPGQQVAAAPPGQRRRHPGRQAVVEPDPPAGQGPQRGVVADQTLAVAQRAAEEGQDLDHGQDADQRAQTRAQRGPADHVARAGQQADGGGGRGQSEQAGQGQAPVAGCPARRGSGAASRASRGHQPPGVGRQGDHPVERGEQRGFVRRHHHGAPAQPGLDGGGDPGHGGRIERGRGLVEQEDRCGAQEGAGQGHPLALPRAEREPVVAELVARPWGRLAMQLGRGRRPPSTASQVLVGDRRERRGAGCRPSTPRRGAVAAAARRTTPARPPASAPSRARRRGPGIRPPAAQKRRSAASTVDFPAPDPPVSATRLPGGQIEGDAVDRGRVAVRVGDAQALDVECRHRRHRVDGPPGGGTAPPSPAPGSGVASTSRTRVAAACPSALAWNSAPARRSGMKISGATRRTAIAVCRSTSPQRSRRPSTMATSPTPNPASMSMASAERKAVRSVRMVAERTPSVAASTSRRPCSSRPKARSVGSPSTSWRKRRAERTEPAPLPLPSAWPPRVRRTPW